MSYDELAKRRLPPLGGVELSFHEEWLTRPHPPGEEYPGTAKKQKPQAEAMRFDGDKTDYSLIPTDGVRCLADHYTLGAKKYAARNWELGMAYSRCYNSLNRHLTAWWEGEDWDTDDKTGSKSLHLVAVVWNAMALLVYSLRGIGTDDRPKIRNSKEQ